jgi:hypothetical protein
MKTEEFAKEAIYGEMIVTQRFGKIQKIATGETSMIG